MAVLLPVSLFAQDVAGAMLHSSGNGVLVNENQIPASIALFPDDLVKTPKGALARIEATGSAAEIGPETIVQFQTGELVLDHGSVSVSTSRAMRVRVGCITVTPVHDAEWTQYEVVDVNGKVTVSALKNDVYIDARSKNFQQMKDKDRERSDRALVRESEQKTREEKCGGADIKGQPMPGIGAAMNSPYAIWAGAAAIVGITCWALCRSDEPLSPAKP